jgi:ribosomal protein L11 methyltransferase
MEYFEFDIRIPDQSRDALITAAFSAGCSGVIEHDENILTYFPDDLSIEAITDMLSSFRKTLRDSGLPDSLSFTCTQIPERDWNETWKNGIRPIDAGYLITIIPPWHTPRAGRVNLIIDPGMAFGTGHHETTRFCLAEIERLTSNITKNRFLDVGTGTGILAIAASKFGFAEIIGVDTDSLAIDAAKRNIDLNSMKNITVMEGDISVTTGTYDFITANLVSEILISIARDISSRLKNDGIALLSGMIKGQEAEVASSFEEQGLKVASSYFDGERWVSLIVTH